MAQQLPLRRCDECKDVYQPRSSRSKYCSKRCNVASSRAGRSTVTEIGPSRSTRSAGPGPTERAVAAELEPIGQAESSLGAMAIALAAQLDTGRDTGSAKASLSRELRTLIMFAKAAGRAPAGSHTDEVRRKREERLAAARGA